jgi:cell wall-associated NlpC family hydrolase
VVVSICFFMKKSSFVSSLLVIALFLPFCSVAKGNPTNEKDPYIALVEGITSYAKKFRGTPYVWGGVKPSGFDCSGFVRYVFNRFGLPIAHSSRDLAEMGYVVKPEEAYAGDLIFFRRSSTSKSEVSHVGIVVSSDEKGVQFIHAASGKGVIYSNLSEKYYKTHFVAIRRVVDVLKEFTY